MTDRKRVALLSAVAAFVGLNSQSLLAQSPALEEVIVTAEKRATTIQDTPIAVTAFTGEEARSHPSPHPARGLWRGPARRRAVWRDGS